MSGFHSLPVEFFQISLQNKLPPAILFTIKKTEMIGLALSTDDIDKLFSQGNPPDESEINFNRNAEQNRERILKDIKVLGYSLSRFADECCIHHSHLYDFLNGKKQLSRDFLLVVCLNLGYSYTEICRILRCFHQPQLYPRDKRDYLILLCIQKNFSVDEINQELERNGFITLCPEKWNKN